MQLALCVQIRTEKLALVSRTSPILLHERPVLLLEVTLGLRCEPELSLLFHSEPTLLVWSILSYLLAFSDQLSFRQCGTYNFRFPNSMPKPRTATGSTAFSTPPNILNFLRGLTFRPFLIQSGACAGSRSCCWKNKVVMLRMSSRLPIRRDAEMSCSALQFNFRILEVTQFVFRLSDYPMGNEGKGR